MTLSISAVGRNAFDCSLKYHAEKPKIRQRMTQEALEEAQRVADTGEHGGKIIARSKAIVIKAFSDFQKIAKQKYPEPENDFLLNGSFQKEYSYFYTELMREVQKILRQKPLSKPVEISSLDEEMPVEV